MLSTIIINVSMVELEWPVGETPDIRSIKARISQRRLLQLSRDEQQLRDPTMVDETSWLHSDGEMLLYFAVISP